MITTTGCLTLKTAMYNQQCLCYRMLIRRPILFSGGHMAPRSRGALRCHALCPVLLRNCKFSLSVTSNSVSVQLAPSPDEFVINCRPQKDRFLYCVCFHMRFGGRLMCLFLWCFVWQQKSRRGKVFGKVNCKNIKQDCPDLDCDDPILLPGHCCKTCPKGN